MVDDEKRDLMLKWCSYCQQFLGEVPDYEDLAITHGMCSGCHPKVLDFTESDFARSDLLKGVQRKLFDAGRRNDLKAAEKIVEDAVKANIRPVDILIGIIAPMLYQIGEDWKKGILSVESEHQFTAFCEKTFDLIAPKVTGDMPANLTRSNGTDVLLMNALGNEHTLAIRILAFDDAPQTHHRTGLASSRAIEALVPARSDVIGTKRQLLRCKTMSGVGGKSDLPVERPDFSV